MRDARSIGSRGACFAALRSDSCDEPRGPRGSRAPAIVAAPEAASPLRRAPQPNDRQVHLPVNSLDFNIESRAGSACDEHLRSGTRRTARPFRPGLDPRSAVGREAPEVKLVWRTAGQAGMRTMLVVPADPACDLVTHRAVSC